MAREKTVVRDKFWVFTCVAGSDRVWLEKGGINTISRMTPGESAFYLDVPNLIMVRENGLPAKPFDQHMISFRPLKRVLWSVVGSGGQHEEGELTDLLELSERFPNITGAFMDDFFTEDTEEPEGHLPLTKLQEYRKRLQAPRRKLELWIVAYTHMLCEKMVPYMNLCDALTLWTWNSDDLGDLEMNLSRLEELSPGPRNILGCYFWDYPNAKPVPLELMQRQCETGLNWLLEGRLDGMIFLGNTMGDFGFESVEWTREWIRNVGHQEV